MDTRLKKTKVYRLKWKALAVILFFIASLSLFFCGLIAANLMRDWNRDIINVETVYDTNEFRNAFSEALDQAVLADVYYQSEAHIMAGGAVDRETLLTGFKRYYGVIDGVITDNTEINAAYDGLLLQGAIPESLQANFEDYRELVESRLPSYYKMYLQRQLDEYKNCIRYLDGMRNFLYYMEDAEGNIVGGNASRSEVNAAERTLVLSAGFSSDHLVENPYFFDSYSNPILEESNLEFHGAIKDPLQPGDIFYDLWLSFSYAKQSLPILFAVSIASVILLFGSLSYLLRVAGQKEKNGEVQYIFVDRIYNEVHFLLMLLFVLLSYSIGNQLLYKILYGRIPFWNYVFMTILGLLYLADTAAGLSYLLSVGRQMKGRIFFRNTWISTSIRRMSELFTGKTFRGWMVIVMLCYGLGNCALMGMLMLLAGYGLMELALLNMAALVGFNGFCMYLFIRALRSLKNIMISVKESAKGNFFYPLDLEKISPSFANFAQDVANIQDGFKNAVDEAVKGERMKAELITNVSHDLKTPLTSIITYADLLKKEPLSNETAAGYVEILYEKSYRLKQLIEDLIEASKASSGSLSVEKQRIDLKQLTMQALGEMEEKTEAAGLVFKISCPEPVLIDADGGHTWRILENLLSNAIKYSIPHSRVYIDIFEMEGFGLLIMKNVSAAPIDFDESRLTERFVRGDTSRTTEGSGLGLSITQSLAELQGGTFGIQVDGDLFKAIVSIPLWTEEEA